MSTILVEGEAPPKDPVVRKPADGDIYVDLSLARGLRSAIVKKIAEAKVATDQASDFLFRRRVKMPTTQKGVRKLAAELVAKTGRYALATNDPKHVTRFMIWHRWALRENISMGSWEEDQLSVDGMVYDLLCPVPASIIVHQPIGASMHLLERVFLRLGTTSNDAVLTELHQPMMLACGMAGVLFAEMDRRGVASMPIVIPSKNGGLAGDAMLDGGEGRPWIALRTYIGGSKGILTPAKRRLLDDLQEWADHMMPISWVGLQLSVMPRTRLEEVGGKWDLAKVYCEGVRAYMEIMGQHRGVLEDRESRVQRNREQKRIWRRGEED